MITSIDIKKGQKPTAEQIEEVKKASLRDIAEDEDAPELTLDQLERYKKAADARKNMKQVTIELTPEEISIAKGYGRNYREVLSRLVSMALADKEMVGKAYR